MTSKPRMNHLSIQAHKRHEAARSEYMAWWNQFSNAELEKIAAGDEKALARCQALGSARIESISRYALTHEEKQELKKIKKELLKTHGNPIPNQEVNQDHTGTASRA